MRDRGAVGGGRCTSTSSTSPSIDREPQPGRETARPGPGRPPRSESHGSLAARPGRRRRARRGRAAVLAGRPVGRDRVGRRRLRRAWSSISEMRTGSSAACAACMPDGREQASPTASRTSSSSASSTPARRATAAAISRAVRTCAGSGRKRARRAMGSVSRSPRRPPRRRVDREDLGQAGDPEDLEDALLGADQAQRALVRADPLEAADQHAEAGGVEELDALHVDHEVVAARC